MSGPTRRIWIRADGCGMVSVAMVVSSATGIRTRRPASLAAAAAALLIAACSYDWEALEPRPVGASAGSAGEAASGGSSPSAGASGVAGVAGQGGGSQAGTTGSGGSSGSGDCPVGQDRCDDACVDLQASPAHCGWCSHACDPGEVCADGGCSAPCDATGLDALLVVANAAEVGSGDQAVVDLLEGLGFAVIVVSTTATAADADGLDLVLISSTAQSNVVSTNFTDVDVPLLCWDSYLYDDLQLTGPTPGTDFNTLIREHSLEIVDPAHPLAAGLTGVVRILDPEGDMAWGVPAGDGAVVAAAATYSAFAVIFALDAGDALANGDPAPARRVGLPLGDASADVLTDDGRRLVETAICWSVRL